MSRGKAYPLREWAMDERAEREAISRERSGSAEWVTRAKLLLRVSAGAEYETAAQEVGRRAGDWVAAIVKRFNEEGLAALASRHGGGPKVVCGAGAHSPGSAAATHQRSGWHGELESE